MLGQFSGQIWDAIYFRWFTTIYDTVVYLPWIRHFLLIVVGIADQIARWTLWLSTPAMWIFQFSFSIVIGFVGLFLGPAFFGVVVQTWFWTSALARIRSSCRKRRRLPRTLRGAGGQKGLGKGLGGRAPGKGAFSLSKGKGVEGPPREAYNHMLNSLNLEDPYAQPAGFVDAREYPSPIPPHACNSPYCRICRIFSAPSEEQPHKQVEVENRFDSDVSAQQARPAPEFSSATGRSSSGSVSAATDRPSSRSVLPVID